VLSLPSLPLPGFCCACTVPPRILTNPWRLQARDSFYECCEKSGSPFTAEQQHPSACRSLRKQYEASCKPSWVKHFDRLKDKEVRVVRVLHSNINERATTSKGNLAGETLSK